MLSRSGFKQNRILVTTLEELMPQEHFLRDLAKHVSFSFIYEKVSHLYSNYGRPSIDPVVLIKMLLLGFLYGIDSERKLEKEVTVNIAFRWFLGIDLDEAVPDHSTISQTRRRKWRNSSIFENIFAEIVQKCIDAGLVDGTLILTDSTHVRANASNKRKEFVTVTVEPREYIKKLDALCEQEDLRVRESAIEKGLKKRGRTAKKSEKTKTVESSITDPDSGILSRPKKPRGFHYLNHQSVDGKSGIITDVYVAPANVNDFEPYTERIKHQINTYKFNICEVGLDAGYDYIEVHKEMYDLGIKTYMPLRDMEKHTKNRIYPPSAFAYNSLEDAFTCPGGYELRYSSIDKHERAKVYRAAQKNCKNCPHKSKCIGGSGNIRTLKIPFFNTEANIQRSNHGTERYFEIQSKRRIYCEGNFAIQKDNYNLRRTRKRGKSSVAEHCIYSAMALNLKRLVKYLKNKESSANVA